MSPIVEFLLGPLSYPFMVRGLLAALTVGIVCAVLGTFVVLRGMAFLGDALAHAILPGVAVGYLVGNGARGPLFAGALLTGLLTALSVGALTFRRQVREDSAIGVIFAGMFALGIALISSVRSYTVDLAHFLFGDVLGVAPGDLLLTACLGALVLLLLLAFYKELVVMAFNPILATTLRLPTRFLHYLLLSLLALTIVLSLQTVGVALTMAMLVTPPAAAYLVARRLPSMMGLSAGIGAFSALSGLYLSYYVNISSGAAIVLVCTLIFGLVFLFSPSRGVLRRRRHGPHSPKIDSTPLAP